MRKNGSLPVFLLVMLLCSISCKERKSEQDIKKYSIYILGKDGREYIVETNSLDSGKIFPEKEGAVLNTGEMDRDIIVKDGSYYHFGRKTKVLSKYRVERGNIQTVSSVPLDNFAPENYYWIGKDSLLLIGLDSRNFKQVKSVLIQSERMSILDTLKIPVPLPSGSFNSTFVGFAEQRRGELLVGYTYHQILNPSGYTTSDTMYIARLNYPQMTLKQINKDTRSTYPGGTNLVQSYTFGDGSGNFYFMSCPGIALGNRPDLPTGIFRIKKGEAVPDKDYFINISGSIGNHAYGMWYLGHNKVIIRSERKDLFKGLNDHYSTAHFEFYLVDLATKNIVRKLDLPLDKGTRRECVIVKGNIAYIAVNSTKEGNFIWMYNISTGSLKKGLELSGNTDFIMRIDQLNP